MTIFFEFITGVSLGIEFFSGQDAMEGDKFAITVDLLIIRLTVIVHDGD